MLFCCFYYIYYLMYLICFFNHLKVVTVYSSTYAVCICSQTAHALCSPLITRIPQLPFKTLNIGHIKVTKDALLDIHIIQIEIVRLSNEPLFFKIRSYTWSIVYTFCSVKIFLSLFLLWGKHGQHDLRRLAFLTGKYE